MEKLLIVGLGNPGPEYVQTRHNLGIDCVTELALRLGVRLDRKRWRSLVGFADLSADRRVWLAWPQTYMNLSGRAVAAAVKDLELDLTSVWAVYDELDLPLCRLRIRVGGSAAGHNGVQSIMSSLKDHQFVRFRVGIGRPPGDGVAHVLGKFTRGEVSALDSIKAGVADALQTALTSGVPSAMEIYNRPGSLGCPEQP
ncbi:MAG: aminoacyl-tRNA hydrolase [Candidatus Dormibacteraeota bacterium]|nr:aminoacyl-tRNA hydrolase [Candidatus Dormibacteraeota bacterium]